MTDKEEPKKEHTVEQYVMGAWRMQLGDAIKDYINAGDRVAGALARGRSLIAMGRTEIETMDKLVHYASIDLAATENIVNSAWNMVHDGLDCKEDHAPKKDDGEGDAPQSPGVS